MRIASLFILSLFAASCASPRVITASTGTKEQIKFLYVQGKDQGVIKCKFADKTGHLTSCKEMTLLLQD